MVPLVCSATCSVTNERLLRSARINDIKGKIIDRVEFCSTQKGYEEGANERTIYAPFRARDESNAAERKTSGLSEHARGVSHQGHRSEYEKPAKLVGKEELGAYPYFLYHGDTARWLVIPIPLGHIFSTAQVLVVLWNRRIWC